MQATLVFVALVLFIAIVLGWWWHARDRQRTGKGHAWVQGIVAFYVAYMICNYAFAKLLKTQFQPPAYILETPIGELNGFWLTWTYFGFSETFANILGWTQVLGSVLVLFRRTRLLGAFILIPVMVNICLIDHFYTISPLAYFNALHYTFILFFFVALETPKLLAVFFAEPTSSVRGWRVWALNIVRVAVVALALLKIYTLRESFEPRTKLNGVWRVVDVKVANKISQDSAHLAWSKLYFEWRYGALMKFSPQVNIPDEFGTYKVDTTRSELTMSLSHNSTTGEPLDPDQLTARYTFEGDTKLTLNGTFNNDSVYVSLARLK